MADDKHARCLVNRDLRSDIYRQLNPWDLASADNCPAAADALFHFLSPQSPRPTSITRALPPNRHGFIYGPGVRFHGASLQAIVHMVRAHRPGFVVVVHGIRPQGALVNGHPLAPDHYFCMVKLGPPENDAFWADCSRPSAGMFFPSQQQTPGQWTDTVQGMAAFNQLRQFEYTTGPFSVLAAP